MRAVLKIVFINVILVVLFTEILSPGNSVTVLDGFFKTIKRVYIAENLATLQHRGNFSVNILCEVRTMSMSNF
jgi:hypothetical protein